MPQWLTYIWPHYYVTTQKVVDHKFIYMVDINSITMYCNICSYQEERRILTEESTESQDVSEDPYDKWTKVVLGSLISNSFPLCGTIYNIASGLP